MHDQIDAAVRVYDKLVLVLSPHSMESAWVIRPSFHLTRVSGADAEQDPSPASADAGA